MKDDELADFVNAITSENESDGEQALEMTLTSCVSHSNSDGSHMLVEETDHMLMTVNNT